MRPCQWNEADKECAREQARLGAIAALEELHVRFSSLFLSKALSMVLGWVLIEAGKFIFANLGTIQGVRNATGI